MPIPVHLITSLSIAMICEGDSPEAWRPQASAGKIKPVYNMFVSFCNIFDSIFVVVLFGVSY